MTVFPKLYIAFPSQHRRYILLGGAGLWPCAPKFAQSTCAGLGCSCANLAAPCHLPLPCGQVLVHAVHFTRSLPQLQSLPQYYKV